MNKAMKERAAVERGRRIEREFFDNAHVSFFHRRKDLDWRALRLQLRLEMLRRVARAVCERLESLRDGAIWPALEKDLLARDEAIERGLEWPAPGAPEKPNTDAVYRKPVCANARRAFDCLRVVNSAVDDFERVVRAANKEGRNVHGEDAALLEQLVTGAEIAVKRMLGLCGPELAREARGAVTAAGAQL